MHPLRDAGQGGEHADGPARDVGESRLVHEVPEVVDAVIREDIEEDLDDPGLVEARA